MFDFLKNMFASNDKLDENQKATVEAKLDELAKKVQENIPSGVVEKTTDVLKQMDAKLTDEHKQQIKDFIKNLPPEVVEKCVSEQMPEMSQLLPLAAKIDKPVMQAAKEAAQQFERTLTEDEKKSFKVFFENECAAVKGHENEQRAVKAQETVDEGWKEISTPEIVNTPPVKKIAEQGVAMGWGIPSAANQAVPSKPLTTQWIPKSMGVDLSSKESVVAIQTVPSENVKNEVKNAGSPAKGGKMIACVVSDDGVMNAFANGKVYSIGKDHPNYSKVKEAINANDAALLESLADIPAGVKNFTQGKVSVVDGVVYYGSMPLHNSMTDRILRLMNEGFRFQPMLKFLENLMENPAKHAVDELYDFLSHRALPITEDGCFLAYKRVREDWTDCHSGQFNNSIGNVLEMPRNQVDDNRHQGCSTGFHVGSIEYVKDFGAGGHVLVTKVNPRDVVSVPTECNCTKLRTCKYEVLCEYTGDLTGALYASSGALAQKPPASGWIRPERPDEDEEPEDMDEDDDVDDYDMDDEDDDVDDYDMDDEDEDDDDDD